MPINPLTQKLDSFFQQYKTYTYKKKDVLVHPDQPNTSTLYIKSGFARAYHITETGDELTLMILKPTDLFPITFENNDFFGNYYIEAMTNVEVIKAPQNEFAHFIKEQSFYYEFLTNTIAQFSWLLTRMEYLVVSRAYTKIVATILSCAQDFGEQKGDSIIIKVPLTHKDIASLAGITRETTCLEMRKLEQKGLIKKSGRFLIVKNLNNLKQESSQDQLPTSFHV